MQHDDLNASPAMHVRTHASGEGVFSKMPGKQAFVAGYIGGVLSICTLGFIIFIIAFFSGGNFSFPSFGGGGFAVKPGPDTNTNIPTGGNGLSIDNLKPIGADEHIRGDLKKAQVVLVEYSDFECPYCKTFTPTLDQVVKEYGDKVAIVFRQFPLSFHANAQKQAEASECVAELGGNKAFWAFHDKLFQRTTSNGTGFALTALGPLAKEVGVNQAKFQSCLDSGKYAQKVQDDEASGVKVGITGTPGTIAINHDGKIQAIEGAQSFATVKGVIDSLLK